MSRAELKVSGALYGGWKTIRIERGMEQISGTFSLGLTDRWAGQTERRPIKAGQACQVLIDGITVITGYVDDVEPSYDAQQHGITVGGRDKTGDLVDCSAIHKSGEWAAGTKLLTVAQDVCAPFGISVIDRVGVGEIPQKLDIDHRTAFEVLETAARMKAVLLVADGLGNLVITRASNKRISTALVEGKNILSASGAFSWKDRHSKYTVKAQAAPEEDEHVPQNHTYPSGAATDAVIDRYRPLIVLAEDQGNGVTLKQRAEWERNVRIGRGNRATVTVQGWKHAGGLWEPNTLVHVRSPYLDVDADLLISTVTYLLDEQGTRCELQLCMPEAFNLVARQKSDKAKD